MSILIDASSPAIVNGTGTGTITTASFTPPTGSLVVAVAIGGWGNVTTTTCALSDSLAGSWTSRATANLLTTNSGGGVVQVSTRVIGSSAAMTVTATYTNLLGGRMLGVYVLTGADTAIGATATQDVTTAASSITKSLTTTATGSLVFGGVDASGQNSTITLASNTAWAPMAGSNPVANSTDSVSYGIIKASSATGTPGALTYGANWSPVTVGHMALVEIKPATNSNIAANDNTNPAADSATVQATVPATTNTGTFTDTATVSVPLPVNDPVTGTDVATVRVFAGDTGAGDEATTILAGGATLKFASDTASSAEATAPLVIKDGDTGSVADSLQTATLGIQGRLPPGPRIVRVGGS